MVASASWLTDQPRCSVEGVADAAPAAHTHGDLTEMAGSGKSALFLLLFRHWCARACAHGAECVCDDRSEKGSVCFHVLQLQQMSHLHAGAREVMRGRVRSRRNSADGERKGFLMRAAAAGASIGFWSTVPHLLGRPELQLCAQQPIINAAGMCAWI